jgi:integrase
MQKQNIVRTKVAPGIWKRDSADGPRYEITYRDSDGRQRRQTVEGGMRAAVTMRADVKSRMGHGETVAPRYDLTFAEAAERYLAAQTALRPATVATYTTAINTHLLPAWGRQRLDRINVDAVARLIERMQTAEYRAEVDRRLGRPESGKVGYEPWAIRGTLVPAGRIFDFARRRLSWAGTNPVRQLDRSERPRLREQDRRILSRDELVRLIAAADAPYRQIIATAGGLGTRLGETLGLTWADVDLDAGTIAVRLQTDRQGRRVELKTARSRRVIEAPGSLVAMLREHKIASPYARPSDFVFTTRTGRALEHRNVARRGLARAARLAGLDSDGERIPTFHELRHGHASAWIAAGGDLVELSARLGHRDPAITAAVYSHEFEAAARSDQRRSRLDALYGADDGSVMAAAEVNGAQNPLPVAPAEVADLQTIRDRRA